MLVAAWLGIAAPAPAEVGAAVSIFSDSRFRGYSISEHQPAALLDLSYDDPSGFYAAVSGSVVASSDEVRPLGLQIDGGYAKRLPSGVTLDLGVVHSEYSHYSSAAGNSYTEVYAGLTRKYLTGRVYVSPHYFGSDTWTVYGEVDGSFNPARRLNLSAHLGMLAPLRHGDRSELTHRGYDWRLSAARELGPVSLQVAWAGGGPTDYNDRRHRRSRLIFGISWPL